MPDLPDLRYGNCNTKNILPGRDKGADMRKKKNSHKKYKFTYINVTVLTLFACLFFVRGYTPYEETEENFFHVKVNGQDVGVLGDKSRAEELLLQARKNVASAGEGLVFMEPEMTIVGEVVLWGEVDREEDVLLKMEAALRTGVRETMHRGYTLKVNEYIIHLASMEEVRQLLQAAVDKYGSNGKFVVELVYDRDREFGVYTANVVEASTRKTSSEQSYTAAGVQTLFEEIPLRQETEEKKDFEDYDLGIITMDFSEDVEVVETYLPESQLTGLEEAINLVIMEQETASFYEVVAGDTLSEIAIRVNIPMDRIVEMNRDILEDVNSMLHIGDKLVITVPEPELSVTRVEERFYEEIYDADIEYIDNDNWYTTDKVVRQKPSAGFRKVVADVHYLNNKEISREILKEEVIWEAVAKVVERGTKIPPTYIKPLSGGRITSYFGYRPRPNVAGATSNHPAIDWATPTGTPIYASNSGTVTSAGWIGSYGYVIYIDHEDGKQTRYAHLSKIQVSVGQKVRQGERIALSGNTGASTGPHVHFEIRIHGTPVNPLDYVGR